MNWPGGKGTGRTELSRSWLGLLLVLVIFTPHAEASQLTTLGEAPEWRLLDSHQGRWSRAEFEEKLWLYSSDHGIYSYLELSEEEVRVYADPEKQELLWRLAFHPEPGQKKVSPYRRKPAELRRWAGATEEEPLRGLRICLDPGHIGGEWSNLEERYFRIRKDPPIEEAELNLITCRHLARLLEEAGAEVVWTKEGREPVTQLRPEDLRWEGVQLLFRRQPRAYEKLSRSKLLYESRWHAELAFYRPAEIGARAQRVRELRPDFTLCMHYNAAPWRNKRRPALLKANKLVVFVLGSFMAEELAYEDQKFNLISKTVGRIRRIRRSRSRLGLLKGWRRA
ncbi:MAG: hypothetical protein HC904_10120 [Blastochloris sp.]|nr:hypothetical protein [Blastochloris sp.]